MKKLITKINEILKIFDKKILILLHEKSISNKFLTYFRRYGNNSGGREDGGVN